MKKLKHKHVQGSPSVWCEPSTRHVVPSSMELANRQISDSEATKWQKTNKASKKRQCKQATKERGKREWKWKPQNVRTDEELGFVCTDRRYKTIPRQQHSKRESEKESRNPSSLRWLFQKALSRVFLSSFCLPDASADSVDQIRFQKNTASLFPFVSSALFSSFSFTLNFPFQSALSVSNRGAETLWFAFPPREYFLWKSAFSSFFLQFRTMASPLCYHPLSSSTSWCLGSFLDLCMDFLSSLFGLSSWSVFFLGIHMVDCLLSATRSRDGHNTSSFRTVSLWLLVVTCYFIFDAGLSYFLVFLSCSCSYEDNEDQSHCSFVECSYSFIV